MSWKALFCAITGYVLSLLVIALITVDVIWANAGTPTISERLLDAATRSHWVPAAVGLAVGFLVGVVIGHLFFPQ